MHEVGDQAAEAVAHMLADAERIGQVNADEFDPITRSMMERAWLRGYVAAKDEHMASLRRIARIAE